MIIILKKICRKIKNLFAPWSFWGSYIVFPLKMRLRKLGIGKDYYKKLVELKNKHSGKRCFIIATGPSLTLDDVNLLKNEITIGENSIFKWYEKMGWVPTYYAMTDPDLTKQVIENNSFDFNQFAQDKCIFNSINMREINCDKAVFVDYNFLDHVYHYGTSKHFEYHPDLEYGVYDCYSITQECIILAMYMGFKEIYILGADNNYLGEKQHFSSYAEEPDVDYQQALKIQIANDLGYEFVKKVADSQNVAIFNATRGGNVKCFERVKLEELF